MKISWRTCLLIYSRWDVDVDVLHWKKLNHAHHFSQIFNFERWENLIQFQTVMLIKTELFGSKSSFQGKALNFRRVTLWSAVQFRETVFSCSRQRHQISSDLREPLSSSDQGNWTTPTRRCIKVTQNFASQGSYIRCKKVNFVFQQITSNLF